MVATWNFGASLASIAVWSHVCLTACEPGVFEQVSSKVSSLAAQLSEMELANEHAMQKWKHDFEQDLSNAKKANAEAEQENSQLAHANKELAEANIQLRQNADGLRRDVQLWEADFRNVQSNFSSSLEFTSHTMQQLAQGRASEKLQILDEISRQEAEAEAERSRQHRVAAIRTTNRLRANRDGDDDAMALLQVKEVPANPTSFLRALDGDMQELKNKHDSDKAQLRQQYRGLLTVERSRKQELDRENQKLVQQHDRLKQTQGKLQAAVKFLENTSKTLESNARSLRMFASRIGIRPVPRAHQNLDEAAAAQMDSGAEQASKVFDARSEAAEAAASRMDDEDLED